MAKKKVRRVQKEVENADGGVEILDCEEEIEEYEAEEIAALEPGIDDQKEQRLNDIKSKIQAAISGSHKFSIFDFKELLTLI